MSSPERQTELQCYCKDLAYMRCVYCQERARKAEDLFVCESWHWNCSPIECAQDAARLGWDAEQTEKAMEAYGFSRHHIDQVLDVIQHCDFDC